MAQIIHITAYQYLVKLLEAMLEHGNPNPESGVSLPQDKFPKEPLMRNWFNLLVSEYGSKCFISPFRNPIFDLGEEAIIYPHHIWPDIQLAAVKLLRKLSDGSTLERTKLTAVLSINIKVREVVIPGSNDSDDKYQLIGYGISMEFLTTSGTKYQLSEIIYDCPTE